MECKQKQQQTALCHFSVLCPFFGAFSLRTLSKNTFNTVTPTLNPEHTLTRQLYAHKSSGSSGGGGRAYTLSVAFTL